MNSIKEKDNCVYTRIEMKKNPKYIFFPKHSKCCSEIKDAK